MSEWVRLNKNVTLVGGTRLRRGDSIRAVGLFRNGFALTRRDRQHVYVMGYDQFGKRVGVSLTDIDFEDRGYLTETFDVEVRSL